MYSKILNLLVINISQKLKKAKVSLETEKKTKEIANFQGEICGLRKLHDNLTDLLGVNIPHMEDAEEDAPVIEEIATVELKELNKELDVLIDSRAWKELLKRVADNKEALKETLFTEGESARELYLAQAQQAGLTIYNNLFNALKDEFERRKEELELDLDTVPFETQEPTEDTTKKRIPNKQLSLPAPKRKGNGKGEGKKT